MTCTTLKAGKKAPKPSDSSCQAKFHCVQQFIRIFIHCLENSSLGLCLQHPTFPPPTPSSVWTSVSVKVSEPLRIYVLFIHLHLLSPQPNGRFEVGKKICLSISGHHPETWQPSWSSKYPGGKVPASSGRFSVMSLWSVTNIYNKSVENHWFSALEGSVDAVVSLNRDLIAPSQFVYLYIRIPVHLSIVVLVDRNDALHWYPRRKEDRTLK